MTRTARPKRPWWRRWLRRLAWVAGGLLVLGFVAFAVAWFRSTNACDDPSPKAPEHPMRAYVYCDYGGPERLRLEAVEKPVPGDDEVLVKIRTVSVNPLDWHFVRGRPYLMRISAGLRKPRETRVGVDFAGTVEAAGKNVTQLAVGDEVFGARTGAFADYVCIGPSRLAKKPPGVSFEQAAGVPVAALTALQGLRDHGKVKPGQTVLINGASGGVGTYAVQIAKSMGAEVTGVCSGRNVELVRRLGADHVVDYTKEDFTKGDRRYDVILDNVGNRSASECRRVLAPEGIYVLIGGGGPGDHVIAGPLLKLAGLAITSPFRKQKMRMMLARVTHEDLAVMADLMQSGKVTTVVDRTYNLGRLPEALAYLETGRARGKVIVTID